MDKLETNYFSVRALSKCVVILFAGYFVAIFAMKIRERGRVTSKHNSFGVYVRSPYGHKDVWEEFLLKARESPIHSFSLGFKKAIGLLFDNRYEFLNQDY